MKNKIIAVKNSKSSLKEPFIFLIIMIIAIFSRLYKFDVIPFGLNHDASLNGLVAIDLWQKLPFYTPYYSGWIGETFYHYWLVLNFLILGIGPETIKLASITIGILTIPIFYLLAKSLQKKTVALFSLFFIATSGWHIIMSKVGWLTILVPLFQSLTFFLLYSALKSGKKIFWIGAGISLAVTLNTYSAAKITPLIIFLVLIFWYFKNRKDIKIKLFLLNIIIFIAAFLIAILPLLNFVIRDWEIYSDRMNFLSVTNKIKETGSLEPVLRNVTTSVGMLHFRANGDDFFINEPLLEKIPGIIFLLGFLAILFSVGKFESFFILTWFFSGFIPGILSVPNGNHDFSILAPTYLIIGQGISIIPLLFQRINKVFLPVSYFLVCLLLIMSFINTYQQYLSKDRREIFGFYPEATIVANKMKEFKNQYNFYLTGNYPRDILTFKTYSGGDPFEKHYIWLENAGEFLAVKPVSKKGLMFFMFPTSENETVADNLLNKFTRAKKSYLWYRDDNIARIVSLVITVPSYEL